MKKVIFVSTYKGYNKDISLYYPGTDGFFNFGMGQFIANEFYSRGYPVVFENWRMDLRINQVMEKKIDGLMCKVFPSREIKYFGEYSKEFLAALKKESGKKDVVFHFMPNHKINYHYFARIIRKNVIIATHLGGPNPYWIYKHQHKVFSLLHYLGEKYFLLNPYNHCITICKPEVDYYEKIGKPVIHMPVFGISREKQFIIKDRKASREKLGLPLEKKILLQVGRADKTRGFDWIMDLIDHFQNNSDYFLVFAGINKEDEYYPELVRRNVYMKEYLPHAELVDYYNAADVLYYLLNTRVDLDFAGTSYVPLESLACGTPVISSSFHHFPGSEVSEVARIPRSKEDVVPMIEEILKANISRERCREIVLKTFSWDEVIRKHWELYSM